jgi:hypothetical protein
VEPTDLWSGDLTDLGCFFVVSLAVLADDLPATGVFCALADGGLDAKDLISGAGP